MYIYFQQISVHSFKHIFSKNKTYWSFIKVDLCMSLAETTATWSKRAKKESSTTIVKIPLKLPLKREVGLEGEGNKELFKGCDKQFKGSLKRRKLGLEDRHISITYYLSLSLSLSLKSRRSVTMFHISSCANLDINWF